MRALVRAPCAAAPAGRAAGRTAAAAKPAGRPARAAPRRAAPRPARAYPGGASAAGGSGDDLEAVRALLANNAAALFTPSAVAAALPSGALPPAEAQARMAALMEEERRLAGLEASLAGAERGLSAKERELLDSLLSRQRAAGADVSKQTLKARLEATEAEAAVRWAAGGTRPHCVHASARRSHAGRLEAARSARAAPPRTPAAPRRRPRLATHALSASAAPTKRARGCACAAGAAHPAPQNPLLLSAHARALSLTAFAPHRRRCAPS